MGHRPFLVLADHLTRNGIAVLRADDRGFAKSTGNYATATTVDFASDAEAGVAYLMTRPEVNKQKIGLVGHSEGGIIAPMVGARSPAVAFMVLLAGSGVPGDEIIVAQSSLIAEASGMPREMADANVRNLRSILDVVKREGDEAAVNAKIQEVFGGQLPPAAAAQLKALTTPWFRYFITLRSRPDAQARQTTRARHERREGSPGAVEAEPGCDSGGPHRGRQHAHRHHRAARAQPSLPDGQDRSARGVRDRSKRRWRPQRSRRFRDGSGGNKGHMSPFSITAGSTDAARRAGITAATKHTIASAAPVAPNATGS